MTNKKSSPQQDNQAIQRTRKKLVKERQRILEELQEAQDAQARALERLHRAEARLQKRTARVQRMAAELMLLHQQLGEPAAPDPLSVSMPADMSATSAEEPPAVGPAGSRSCPRTGLQR